MVNGLVNKISVCRLVFREVPQVLQDWFAALTKIIKRVTRKQEDGFLMYFWHFMGNFQFQFDFSFRFDEKIS